jgi:hypothetical protein
MVKVASLSWSEREVAGAGCQDEARPMLIWAPVAVWATVATPLSSASGAASNTNAPLVNCLPRGLRVSSRMMGARQPETVQAIEWLRDRVLTREEAPLVPVVYEGTRAPAPRPL